MYPKGYNSDSAILRASIRKYNDICHIKWYPLNIFDILFQKKIVKHSDILSI